VESLLRRYHDGLRAHGVAGYEWEECRRHYRQSLLYTLAPGVAMLGAMAIAGDERGLADALVLPHAQARRRPRRVRDALMLEDLSAT